jgi:DNA-binding NarL/FixJ family response regulator
MKPSEPLTEQSRAPEQANGLVQPESGGASMTERTLRVLLLEDNPADAELVTETLVRSGLAAVVERVDSREAYTQALREFAPDVVLSDHALAQFDARSALDVLREIRPIAALIVVAGSLDEKSAATFVRAGAEEFVLKGDLSRLVPAIEAALTIRRPLEKLTPRQLEVLRLMAKGHTTPSIARELQLSGKTIETHRGEVMKRVGIHDIVGLVRYAVRVGLVSPDA